MDTIEYATFRYDTFELENGLAIGDFCFDFRYDFLFLDDLQEDAIKNVKKRIA